MRGTGRTGPEDDEGREGSRARHDAPEKQKKGEFMSFKDLVLYLRARYASEEGQTMAEYGVVLAVIAIGVVVALTALAGGISGAIDRVVGNL
jgi:Flp pilus assembly pilin Flp